MVVEVLGATLWTLDGDALGRLAGSSLGDGLGLSDKEGDAVNSVGTPVGSPLGDWLGLSE